MGPELLIYPLAGIGLYRVVQTIHRALSAWWKSPARVHRRRRIAIRNPRI